jgi:outer membrane protein assembly factor BamB
MARDLDFFVSYAGPDLDWAAWATSVLRNEGYTVELDAWDWEAGANAVARMAQALQRARRMVALFSPAYFEPQRFTQDEWTAVQSMRGDGRLLPVLIEETPKEEMPTLLRPLVAVRLYGVSEAVARERLLAAAAGKGMTPADDPPFPGRAAGTGPASAAAPRAATPRPSRPPRASAPAKAKGKAVPKAKQPPPVPPTGPGSLVGRYATGGPVAASPVVAGDLVLVGSDDGLLHAVDRHDLTGVWTAPCDGLPRAAPAVDGDLVLLGGDHGVAALRLGSGAPLWSFRTAEPIRSTPLLRDGTVYAAGYDANVYARTLSDRARTPAARWRHARPAAQPGTPAYDLSSSPCVAAGRLFVGGRSGRLSALDAGSGKELWSEAIGPTAVSSPAVTNGTVYVGGEDGRVRAFRTASGQLLWAFEADAPVHSSPALHKGVLYIGGNDAHVYALDAATGERRWAFPTDRKVVSTPCVSGGTVYVGSHDGLLYALDATTGRRLWRFDTHGPVTSSPVVAGGIVYVGSASRFLYAVRA